MELFGPSLHHGSSHLLAGAPAPAKTPAMPFAKGAKVREKAPLNAKFWRFQQINAQLPLLALFSASWRFLTLFSVAKVIAGAGSPAGR